jgi:hypothetical protein
MPAANEVFRSPGFLDIPWTMQEFRFTIFLSVPSATPIVMFRES